MTPHLTVPLGPRFRSRDALAATALDALGEAVAVVDRGEVALATAAFRRKAGEEGVPAPAERLIAAGGGLEDGGPEGTVVEVRPCPLPSGRTGWVVRLREPAEGLALLDPLTGLPNRRAFDARLGEEVARAARTGRPLSLVLLDLDHFKRVNDEHGHPAGDAVLVEASRRLTTAARPGDALARVGGEEFAWLLPEAGAEEAVAAADRARSAVSERAFAEDLHVTASAGVCELEAAGGCGAALYRLADEALYSAKAYGRDMALAWRPPAAEAAEPADGEPGAHAWVRLQRDADEVDRMLGDPGHAAKVARLAVALAVALDWPAHLQAQLHRAATLHDVGKRPLLPALLRRRARLTPAQRAHVGQHPRIGEAMAAGALAPEACGWIRHHHERWDGGGHPDGLRADAIPAGAQLLAIADAYDAMRSPRPYRDALTEEAALAEVDRGAGTQFRPDAGVLLRHALGWLAGA